MKQKLLGSRQIVVAVVPRGGKHDMPELEEGFCPPTPSSMGARPTRNRKCRVSSISSSVSDICAGAGNGSRQPERTGTRAAESAIGAHGRFRNPPERRTRTKPPAARG